MELHSKVGDVHGNSGNEREDEMTLVVVTKQLKKLSLMSMVLVSPWTEGLGSLVLCIET